MTYLDRYRQFVIGNSEKNTAKRSKHYRSILMASIWTVGLATIVLLVFLVYSNSKEINHNYDDVLPYNKTNSPLIAFNHAAVVSDAPGCAIYGR